MNVYPYNLILDVWGTFQGFNINFFDENLKTFKDNVNISDRDYNMLVKKFKENISYSKMTEYFDLSRQGIHYALIRVKRKMKSPENTLFFLNIDKDKFEPSKEVRIEPIDLTTPITDLGFSKRVFNSLTNANATTLYDIIELSRTDFKGVQGLSKAGIQEIQGKLSALDYSTASDGIRQKLTRIKNQYHIDNKTLINIARTL